MSKKSLKNSHKAFKFYNLENTQPYQDLKYINFLRQEGICYFKQNEKKNHQNQMFKLQHTNHKETFNQPYLQSKKQRIKNCSQKSSHFNKISISSKLKHDKSHKQLSERSNQSENLKKPKRGSLLALRQQITNKNHSKKTNNSSKGFENQKIQKRPVSQNYNNLNNNHQLSQNQFYDANISVAKKYDSYHQGLNNSQQLIIKVNRPTNNKIHIKYQNTKQNINYLLNSSLKQKTPSYSTYQNFVQNRFKKQKLLNSQFDQNGYYNFNRFQNFQKARDISLKVIDSNGAVKINGKKVISFLHPCSTQNKLNQKKTKIRDIFEISNPNTFYEDRLRHQNKLLLLNPKDSQKRNTSKPNLSRIMAMKSSIIEEKNNQQILYSKCLKSNVTSSTENQFSNLTAKNSISQCQRHSLIKQLHSNDKSIKSFVQSDLSTQNQRINQINLHKISKLNPRNTTSIQDQQENLQFSQIIGYGEKNIFGSTFMDSQNFKVQIARNNHQRNQMFQTFPIRQTEKQIGSSMILPLNSNL